MYQGTLGDGRATFPTSKEKYNVFNVMGFVKSLHVLVINPRMDDDFYIYYLNNAY